LNKKIDSFLDIFQKDVFLSGTLFLDLGFLLKKLKEFALMKKIALAALLGLGLMGTANAQSARDVREVGAAAVSGGAASIIFWNTMASTTALATAGVGVGVGAGVYAIYKAYDYVTTPAPAPVAAAPAKPAKKAKKKA
jgi:hypothetical protein